VTDAELQALMTERMLHLAKIIDASPESLPGFSPRDGAIPFGKVSDGEMHWITVERGQELERRTTRDLNEWLCWVFVGVTRDQAWLWERRNRIDYVEPRLSAFCRHLELLARLDEGWANAELAGYRKTLERSPYSAEDYPRDERGADSLRFLVDQIRGGAPEDASKAEAINQAYGQGLSLTRAQEGLVTCALIASEHVLHQGTSLEIARALDPWARRLFQA
jgi:hypothetical protein